MVNGRAGSKTTMSASEPGASVPLRGYSPKTRAGFSHRTCTSRTALITGYHFAWDFTLATIFGIEALSEGEYSGLFTASLTSLVQINDSGVQIASYLPLVLMGLTAALLQGAAWLALLGWVHWRRGGVRVRADMARPTLRGQ